MQDRDSGPRADGPAIGLGAWRRHPLGRLLVRLIGPPDGRADLVHVERRRRRIALRREARRLVAAGLLAPRWYAREYPEARRGAHAAAEDYLLRGAGQSRDPSADFKTRRYLELVPEAGRDGLNPLTHFLDRAEAQDASIPTELRGEIENLPASVHTGGGTALFVKGWAYASHGRIRFLDLMLDDARYPIVDHSRPRPDVLDAETAQDPEGNAFFSGFETVLQLPATTTPAEPVVRLRLITQDGAVLERQCGTLRVLPGDGATPLGVSWPGDGPRVAICMATHNPPLDLFATQVASIKAQTHTNWVCIVSDDRSPAFILDRMASLLDDPRFVFSPSHARLGFYANFERALRLCPADADVVALSDQDDRWYPDKIASLIDALGAEAQLAYSDVRIVDRDGTPLADTFWTSRRNNYTSLPSLMAANTVIGAASLFRASLLRQVLPFPERLGAAYHDHWIALNALAAGAIRYVDRPLHDYVQHGENVIGHKRDRDAPGLADAGLTIARALRRRGPIGRTLRDILNGAVEDRQSLVAQKVVLARVLMQRHPAMRGAKRQAVARMARLSGIGSALRERLLSAVERRPTLNHEGHFLRAVLISRIREAAYAALRGSQTRRIRRRRYGHAVRNLMADPQTSGAIDFAPNRGGRDLPAMTFGHIGWIFHNVAALTLRPSQDQPRRINLLLATINFDYLFGGYIGMFNLALKLRRTGYAIRIVLLDETDVDLGTWRGKIARYPGLGQLFDEIEVAYRHDRSLPLDVHPNDGFVATSGWSAHVAHKAVTTLGRERFMFLIQEYEPFFGPMNTNTALLRQAYDFPQFGLFSTAILRDYFRVNRIGLFEGPDGDTMSAVFSNAIQRFSPGRAQLERASRRILFYARPEDHAARNMFEMGIAALVELFKDHSIAAAGWTAHGIGSIGVQDRLELAPGVFLQMVPKTSLQDYAAMLPGFDVGLSLMLTPHPSLVPLEMAAAGLSTVTNTFANKTEAALTAISTNLIGVKPTLEGIVAGLHAAIARVDDIDARLAGAKAMTWPTDWDSAFPPETMAKVAAFLGDPMDPPASQPSGRRASPPG